MNVITRNSDEKGSVRIWATGVKEGDLMLRDDGIWMYNHALDLENPRSTGVDLPSCDFEDVFGFLPPAGTAATYRLWSTIVGFWEFGDIER